MIAHQRKMQEIAQIDAARAAGLSAIRFSRIERGLEPVDLDMLRRIAKAIGVTPADLLGRSDNRTIHTAWKLSAVRRS